jgi:hypothetical protein
VKTRLPVLVLALALFGGPAFAGGHGNPWHSGGYGSPWHSGGAVRLTGNLSADIFGSASTEQSVSTFAVGGQPLFWGFGWEVILGKVGFGGDCAVSFFQDAGAQWWLDWLAPALFASYHPLGANTLLDPFVEVGLGCAGRVMLARRPMHTAQGLELSLYPFVAGGLNLNLDGLLVGAKLAYTPYASPIPVTDIPRYPLGSLQLTMSAGVSLGW